MKDALIYDFDDGPLSEEQWQKLRDRYRDHFVQLSDRALKLLAYSDPTLAAYHEPEKDGENVDKSSAG